MPRDGAQGRDPPGRDEERLHEPLRRRGREAAELGGAGAVELAQVDDDAHERGDAVAKPRGVLEPLRLGETPDPCAEPRERRAGAQSVEVGGRGAAKRPRGELRSAAASNGAELRRRRGDANAVAAALEVDVAVGARAAHVGRRSQRPDQA